MKTEISKTLSRRQKLCRRWETSPRKHGSMIKNLATIADHKDLIKKDLSVSVQRRKLVCQQHFLRILIFLCAATSQLHR